MFLMKSTLVTIFIFGYLLTTDCMETTRTKRARRPVRGQPPPGTSFGREPEQNLDAKENKNIINNNRQQNNNNNYNQQKTSDPDDVSNGFLSPSVREYLELGKSIPGRPGTDYPILSAIPYTNFYCDEQLYPGFFADMETRCQGWHYCDIDGRQASFLCPNGTQFSQAVFVCDWWFNVRCDISPRLYSINARLYQRPKLNPTRPHRIITKQLVDDIFN